MVLELPPQARGRQGPCRAGPGDRGTTPAGAGTTAWCPSRAAASRSYPRRRRDDGEVGPDEADGRNYPCRRGDDKAQDPFCNILEDLPVRTRARLGRAAPPHARRRTTPAGAGTTVRTRPVRAPTTSYPRGRGDDSRWNWRTEASTELPPRARGRQGRSGRGPHDGGTTPAGAGTTSSTPPSEPSTSNYPRRRGDDDMSAPEVCDPEELPPRARGRLAGERPRPGRRGTTPAGAGTTTRSPLSSPAATNYPRGRGDDALSCCWVPKAIELPPRARGRLRPPQPRTAPPGTTPTGAGTTPCAASH